MKKAKEKKGKAQQIHKMSEPENGQRTAKNIALKSTKKSGNPQPGRAQSAATIQQNRYQKLLDIFGNDDAGKAFAFFVLGWLSSPTDKQAGPLILAFDRLHETRKAEEANKPNRRLGKLQNLATLKDAVRKERTLDDLKRIDKEETRSDWDLLYRPLRGEKGGREKW